MSELTRGKRRFHGWRRGLHESVHPPTGPVVHGRRGYGGQGPCPHRVQCPCRVVSAQEPGLVSKGKDNVFRPYGRSPVCSTCVTVCDGVGACWFDPQGRLGWPTWGAGGACV